MTPEDNLRRPERRQVQRLDHGLVEMRAFYLSLDSTTRSHLREWFAAVAALEQNKPRTPWLLKLSIEAEDVTHDAPGNVVAQRARLSPDLLTRAVEAWERRETFNPRTYWDAL